jgi:hypothetical protein
MTTLQEFNEKLFKGQDIHWYDNKGIFKINKDLNAIIELGCKFDKHFWGYEIKIINKNHGKIDEYIMFFDKHILRRDDNKIFNRPEVTFNMEKGFYWNNLQPDENEIKSIINDIFNYITEWA